MIIDEKSHNIRMGMRLGLVSARDPRVEFPLDDFRLIRSRQPHSSPFPVLRKVTVRPSISKSPLCEKIGSQKRETFSL